MILWMDSIHLVQIPILDTYLPFPTIYILVKKILGGTKYPVKMPRFAIIFQATRTEYIL